MAPGPPPKLPARRQRTVRRDLGPVETPAPAEVPELPRGFLKITREGWAAFWTSPVAGALDRASDLPALLRLFSLRDERERCARVFAGERLVAGSRGQVALNPLAKQVSTLDAEIRQLEDRFGLTPLARLRLGVSFNEAVRSLEELNRVLAQGVEDEPDPRLQIVDAEVVDTDGA